ncbi:MAG: hypothetical protein IPI61_14750 [Syntrophaceae bacterium]|nr:hypothetical protein [Syntrophaceae bacterium]
MPLDVLRGEGSAGVVGFASYRPFPPEGGRRGIRSAKAIVPFEKSISGYEGLWSDPQGSLLRQRDQGDPIHDHVAGPQGPRREGEGAGRGRQVVLARIEAESGIAKKPH